MQSAATMLAGLALVVVIASVNKGLKQLPWIPLILWAAIGGAANSEITLLAFPGAGSRWSLYFWTSAILLVFLAAGTLASRRSGEPSFPHRCDAWRISEIGWGLVTALSLGALVLLSWRFSGANEAYNSLIDTIRASRWPVLTTW